MAGGRRRSAGGPGRRGARSLASTGSGREAAGQPGVIAIGLAAVLTAALARGSWQWFATYIGVTLLAVIFSFCRHGGPASGPRPYITRRRTRWSSACAWRSHWPPCCNVGRGCSRCRAHARGALRWVRTRASARRRRRRTWRTAMAPPWPRPRTPTAMTPWPTACPPPRPCGCRCTRPEWPCWWGVTGSGRGPLKGVTGDPRPTWAGRPMRRRCMRVRQSPRHRGTGGTTRTCPRCRSDRCAADPALPLRGS